MGRGGAATSGPRARRGRSDGITLAASPVSGAKKAPLHVVDSSISPAPLAPPPFTVASLRAAVPAHCFERSAVTSLAYAARDVAGLAVLAYAATFIDRLPSNLAPLAWLAYWYAAGCVGTGLWMIGHECGHGAFSTSPLLNFVIGTLSHTFLLVPYSAWRITHARHHRATNSIEHDEPFVPSRECDVVAKAAIGFTLDVPSWRAVQLAVMLLLGWPSYLTLDLGGPSRHGDVAASRRAHGVLATTDHFLPTSVLFDGAGERGAVALGTCIYAAFVAGLVTFARTFGFTALVAWYGIPLLIVNAHLVIITFLQHTDSAVPHYRESEFSWLRGALSTIDRTWGPTLDVLFHHISDTHVTHHIFHEIPFYHAVEATAALRKVLGPYYLRDEGSIYAALWRNAGACKFEDGGEVAWMKPISAIGKGKVV